MSTSLKWCWLSLSLGEGPWRVVISGALSFQVKLVSVYAGELAQRCPLSMVAADKEVSLELFLRS
ncbi:hypothetical protein Bca4012_052205 [Brassica carinata]|uniref:(rape) hypothetical protein n=1 Tax=Brassica napus TaxID=3708 RepID=A0A816KJN7_BRANA|nr:unnamed protein product [Brassica napus]